MKCGWSWRTMVVVERIWRMIIVENAHWIRVTKKFYNFSVTNGRKNAQISKFTFDFFYRKRWFKWLFLTSNDRKGYYISNVWWISFCESFKLKIFIFCIRVMKFYTFSWNCSYTNSFTLRLVMSTLGFKARMEPLTFVLCLLCMIDSFDSLWVSRLLPSRQSVR